MRNIMLYLFIVLGLSNKILLYITRSKKSLLAYLIIVYLRLVLKSDSSISSVQVYNTFILYISVDILSTCRYPKLFISSNIHKKYNLSSLLLE